MTQLKTLDDLTPEILAKIPEYQKRAVDGLYDGSEYDNWKYEDTEKYVHYCYKLAGQATMPFVIVANTVLEYKKLFNLLTNENNEKIIEKVNLEYSLLNNEIKEAELTKKLKKVHETPLLDLPYELTKDCDVKKHYLFLLSEYSRVYLMWYAFIQREFDLPCSKKEELDWLYENVNAANIAKGYFCERFVLILRMPRTIVRKNDVFHCSTYDGAVAYPDQKVHYLNGRQVEDWVFDKYFNKTLTFEDLINEKNEDTRAAIVTLIKENEGDAGLLKFLNAELVDTFERVHKNGYKDIHKLYLTKEAFSFASDSKGNSNVKLAFHEEICPSTKQTFLLATCPSMKTAEESAKFLRPAGIPENHPYYWTQTA